MDCDCNPSEGSNRVCLYTAPLANIPLVNDYFDFSIGLRNFYRSATESITDITTTVVSCAKSGGGSCTWSESGSTDFLISINPDYIASNKAGDFGSCGLTPQQCSSCSTGRVSTIQSRITINNAADGTYTLRYRVSYNPLSLYRDIDVTISFTSSGCTNQCTSGQQQCVGSTQYQSCTTSGGCLVWGAAQNCPSGQTCTNGQCAASCSNDCTSGARQCSGAGFQTCGNYDADSCTEWSSVTACPSGQACTNGQCGSASHAGDLNSDNRVNIMDLILVAQNYGKTSGFNPLADANKDGRINIMDLIVVAQNYGWSG